MKIGFFSLNLRSELRNNAPGIVNPSIYYSLGFLLQIIPQYGSVSVYASRITDTPGPENYSQKVGPAGMSLKFPWRTPAFPERVLIKMPHA